MSLSTIFIVLFLKELPSIFVFDGLWLSDRVKASFDIRMIYTHRLSQNVLDQGVVFHVIFYLVLGNEGVFTE